MAYAIGTLLKGTGEDTHYQLLALIRHLCGGFGDVGAIGGTRTGTGDLSGVEASPTSVTETWTLECTTATAGGGTFSVTGSVTGATAPATVGAAYDNGKVSFTLNDGATDFVVGDTFTIPVTQGQLAAEGQAWEILRYDTVPANRELIMKAPGLSGTEEIFLGVRTYQNFSGDYYNLLLGAFTGYVPGNSFDTQPGGRLTGVPAHNNAITYYISVNGQRLVFMLKVGTPVYTHGYLGKMCPYARPSEFPYPVVCAGILNGAENTRFSATTNYFPYHGYTVSSNTNFYLRKPDGVWLAPAMWPFTHGSVSDSQGSYYCLAGSVSYSCQVPANAQYQMEPIILHDRVSSSNLSNNIWGELDGVFFVSGFNNAVENVVQYGGSSTVDQTGMTPLQAVQAIKAVGGRAFVMGQNINRTSWRDYVAIEM